MLKIGYDGHLFHPNIPAPKRFKDKASDRSVARVTGEMVGVLLCLQFFGGELKAKGLAEDRIAKSDCGPVRRRTMRDLSDHSLFGHDLIAP
jgi:hypothetical protein